FVRHPRPTLRLVWFSKRNPSAKRVSHKWDGTGLTVAILILNVDPRTSPRHSLCSLLFLWVVVSGKPTFQDLAGNRPNARFTAGRVNKTDHHMQIATIGTRGHATTQFQSTSGAVAAT